MRVARPGKSSAFYPDVAQAAWGVLCARIARADGAGLAIAVLDSAAECEFFYPKLKYFLELDGKPFEIRMLPGPPRAADSDAARFDAACERIGTLRAMADAGREGRPQLFAVATAEALFAPAPSPSAAVPLEISAGMKISPRELREKLAAFGYYNETLCEAPGQFAARGGILDVYPVSADAPVRIDFFGDEIDAIRKFDPDTQLADAKIFSAAIDPIPETFGAGGGAWNALDYLGKGRADWIFFEPSAIAARSPDLFLEPEDGKIRHRGFGEVFARMGDGFFAVSSLETPAESFGGAEKKIFRADGARRNLRHRRGRGNRRGQV